jgi:hypothetical protein
MPRPLSTRSLATGLLLGMLGTLGLSGQATAAAAAPGDTGWIRAAHLAPGTPKADVVLTPFSGGESAELNSVGFSDVTDYARVPTGLYTVDIRADGAAAASAPMVTQTVRVTPDSAITVVASGPEGSVTAQAVYDDLRAPAADQAKVRLISAVPGTSVTARVADGGPLLAEDVTTGSATGYAEVAAQTWAVELDTADGASAQSRVPVAAGGVYTLLALSDDDGGVELQAIQDSAGSSVMPQGGADTGAGGLAATGSDAPGTPLLLALAGGGLLGLAVVTLRRSGRRADDGATG